jgi:hypothetical protein
MNLREFLKDEKSKRWHTNLSKGSIVTANKSASVLGRFEDLTGVNRYELLKMAKPKLVDFLNDSFDDFEKKNHFYPTYIMEFKKSILSWLDFNGISLEGHKIKIRTSAPRTYEEQVPRNEELRTLLSISPPKVKVMISLMAFSFLRPESLGNYDGTDGLILRDFVELEIRKDGEVSIEKIPCQLQIRQPLSKARHRYVTFVCAEACDYVKDYLILRIKAGETLAPGSPLLPVGGVGSDSSHGDGNKKEGKKFMSTDSIGRSMRRYIRKAGFSWRPYIFRCYGDTQLDVAEGKGLVSHSWRQFWMGHKGDIEARYSTNKHLASEIIEDMRKSYQKIAETLLQTTTKARSGEIDFETKFRERLLTDVAGLSQEQVEKLNLSEMKQEEFQKLLREKITGLALNNGNKQKIVKVEELDSLLTQGFEFLSMVNGDRAIVKVPSL